MAKILVADDEPDLSELIELRFDREIQARQYEFIFANDGMDALEKLKQHPDIDIVLSDINMPKMDGLAFLTRLGEFSSTIKAVMVSAYGDLDNIRVAMNRGAFDFVTKPISFSDLSVTMSKAIKHVNEVRESIAAIRNYQSQLEKRNKQLEKIAWQQSHGLRAPIARLLGLIELINMEQDQEKILEILARLGKLAHEVDTEIKEIVSQTNSLDLSDK